MKLEIPIIVGFDNMGSFLDDLKKLQTYKLFEGDEMVLVDIEDVTDVLVKHIKAKEKQPDAYENALKLAKYGLNSPPSAQPEQCDFCKNRGLEDGDTLYISADWDGGIGFDFIRDIHYCPKCGRRL